MVLCTGLLGTGAGGPSVIEPLRSNVCILHQLQLQIEMARE